MSSNASLKEAFIEAGFQGSHLFKWKVTSSAIKHAWLGENILFFGIEFSAMLPLHKF